MRTRMNKTTTTLSLALAALAAVSSHAVAGENPAEGLVGCPAPSAGAIQVSSTDRNTSILMLGGSTYNSIDVSPLLAQRPLRAGVDDVRRPGFNGMGWNGTVPPANQDAYASQYGAAGLENAVIVVHLEPRVNVAIHPFAPIPTFTADGQRMSPDVVRKLEHLRSNWLRDNGYTGGVRTFTNDRPYVEKKDVSQIKPRAIIELNPEAPRLKSRMQVRVNTQAPKVLGVATTGATQADGATKVAAKADEPKPAIPAVKAASTPSTQEKKVQPAMKVAIATTNAEARPTN